MDIVKLNGKDVPVKQAIVKTTITNKKTGAIYKNDGEWKALNIPAEDIKRDVSIQIPSLDLFGKTK
jgi:hypothetical protein